MGLAAIALMILTLAAITSGAASPAAAQPSGFGSDWPVYHGNGLGAGVDPTGGSNLASPRRAWTSPPLDGELFGEPLVEAGRVFVATENNTVYALAANTGQVLWSTHIATPVPSSDLPCGDVGTDTPNGTVGITSTPAIDPALDEIFVVDDQLTGAGGASHHLIGLNLFNGAVSLNTPVDPSGSHPLYQLQRPGLALDAGQVVIGFGGNDGDCETAANPYHGWLVAVPEGGGSLRTFEVASSTGDSEGAIWMGGAAPIVDAAGNIWVATGNSAFVSPDDPYDNSDGVLELNANLQLEHFFAPSTWSSDNGSDLDLGSSSPSLMADGLVLQAGKSQTAYAMSQATLGGVGGQEAMMSSYCGRDVDGGSAISGEVVYTPCENGVVKTQVTPGSPPTITAVWRTATGSGGPPILTGGLVWTIDKNTGNLYGLNPATGDAEQSFSLGSEASHFPTPSVGDGLLLAPASNTIVAFDGPAGLPPPPVFPSGFWTAFHPLSGAGVTRGVVTFAPGSNGSLQELFVSDPGGRVLMAFEMAGGAWSSFRPLSGPGVAGGPVTFAPGSNGSLQELFVAGPGGEVWTEYEVAGGAWRGWHPLSGPGVTGGPVTVAPGSNGSLQELFVSDPGGRVLMAVEMAGGAWSSFRPLSGPGVAGGPVTFAPGSNGSLQELFVAGPGGQVWTDYEVAGGAWRGWYPLGGPGAADGVVTFAPGSNGSLQELFVAGPGGEVWTDYEVAGGAWPGWHPLSRPGVAGGPVTFAPGSNGSLQELFGPSTDAAVSMDYEVAGGAWRGWHPLSGPGVMGGPVTSAPGSNGSLQELFFPGPDAEVWTAYEHP